MIIRTRNYTVFAYHFFPAHKSMTRYLIDIRLMGPVKCQIEKLSRNLEERFRLGNQLAVPHITLVGPFFTEHEDRLSEDFSRICQEQQGVPNYDVGGYGVFPATRVVFVTVTPDHTLREFRFRLAQAIAPYCTLREYDRDNMDDFRFHATLAMKLDWLTFQRVRWYIRNCEPVIHRHHPIRATLLKNSRIVCEYDFLQERMLSPAQAMSRATFMRDLAIIRAWESGEPESDP